MTQELILFFVFSKKLQTSTYRWTLPIRKALYTHFTVAGIYTGILASEASCESASEGLRAKRAASMSSYYPSPCVIHSWIEGRG